MKKLIACLFGLFITLPAMATLPQAAINAGYTEVEYIQSSGTQYIDTGINGKTVTQFEIKGTVAPNAGSNTQLLGGTSSDAASFFGARANQGIYWYCMNSSNGPLGDPSHVSVINASIVSTTSQPGTLFDTETNRTIEFAKFGSTTWAFPDQNLLVFGGAGYRKSPNAKCYYLKLYTQNGLVADFVPVKKTVNGTDVYGMYNVLDSNPETAFYGNKGDGEFTAGPEVVQPNCNMFDRSTVTNGHYIAVDGSIGDNEASMYSDYIQVKPSTTYTISLVVGYQGNAVRVHDYSANKTWISQKNDVSTGAVGSNYTATFTTSSNAKYIRFGCRQAHTNIKIEEGSTATSYVPYDASCHTTANTCNNLFDGGIYAHGQWDGQGVWSTTNADLRIVGSLTPITPNTTYTMKINNTSDNVAFWNYAYFDANRNWLGNRTINGESQAFNGSTEKTFTITDANARYFAPIVAIGNSGTETITDAMFRNAHIKIEQGETPTEYCAYRGKIKIATTKYNNAAFSSVVTALSNAVDTIKTVVANTITQATAVANLQSGKQQRPDASCPDYKQCLLVEDESGTPHWYVITDPFRDFVMPIIANGTAPATATALAGYTQLDYIEATGTQYINTDVAVNNENSFELEVLPTSSSERYLLSQGNNSLRVSTSRVSWYSRNAHFSGGSSSSEFLNIECGLNYLKINGANVTGASDSDNAAGTSVYLFASNGATPTNYMQARIKKFKIWNSEGTLVRNFVPVLNNVTKKFGMYDKVNNRFYGNAASSGDDFTPGSIVTNDAGVPEMRWSATWTANANSGIAAGTINGIGICNNISYTTQTYATAAQLASQDWTTLGRVCWCKTSDITSGNQTIPTTDAQQWVLRAAFNAGTLACAQECVAYCRNFIETNATFRETIFGM